MSKISKDPGATVRDRLGLITEDELFAMLKISPGTGRNRQAAGTLPAHSKLGREKVFDVEDVRAWIKRNRITRKPVTR